MDRRHYYPVIQKRGSWKCTVITLLSCMSKLFTAILNKRKNKVIEDNNVLSDAQFGFRSGRSTTDAIFILNALIQKVLNGKERLYCCFIDVKRAFDSVYLNGLFLKLNKSGIGGKTLKIIKSIYSNIKNRVRACNFYSDFFIVRWV